MATKLLGKKYGRLTVTKEYYTSCNYIITCECDCGVIKEYYRANIVKGYTQSCGCYRSEKTLSRITTHNSSSTDEYKIWCGILRRCRNTNDDSYKKYGAKGITVCDRWLQFENFISDMGARPKGYQIDRIDNTKGYSPDNCRWVTPIQNARNKSNNRLLTYDNQTRPLSEWAEIVGISANTLYTRLFRDKRSIGEALCTPIRGF